MLRDIESLPDDTVVLLQPCGHNPTGIDPTMEQWDKVLELFKRRRGLLPFFDTAYFGFASGSLETDIYPVRKF